MAIKSKDKSRQDSLRARPRTFNWTNVEPIGRAGDEGGSGDEQQIKVINKSLDAIDGP